MEGHSLQIGLVGSWCDQVPAILWVGCTRIRADGAGRREEERTICTFQPWRRRHLAATSGLRQMMEIGQHLPEICGYPHWSARSQVYHLGRVALNRNKPPAVPITRCYANRFTSRNPAARAGRHSQELDGILGRGALRCACELRKLLACGLLSRRQPTHPRCATRSPQFPVRPSLPFARPADFKWLHRSSPLPEFQRDFRLVTFHHHAVVRRLETGCAAPPARTKAPLDVTLSQGGQQGSLRT